MGWNRGYEIFEATVIGAYDLGKLDKALLSVLMEPYRGSDIDSGGRRDLLATDGKGIEQVVVETWGLPCPARPGPDATDDDMEDYDEQMDDLFWPIRNHFGWD